jgi:hypothetical protein
MLSVRYTRMYYQSPFQRHHYLSGSISLQDIFKDNVVTEPASTTYNAVKLLDTLITNNIAIDKHPHVQSQSELVDDNEINDDSEDDKKPPSTFDKKLPPTLDDVLMTETLLVDNHSNKQSSLSSPNVPILNDPTNLYVHQSFYYGDRFAGEPRHVYRVHAINNDHVVAR